MEREYVRLLEEFKKKLEDRGFRRVDLIDRGLRAWIVVDGDPTKVGLKYHGLWVSGSSEVCRVPIEHGGLFPYGSVPREQVCLRRIRQEVLAETPIAVRLDVSWLNEELFWPYLAWLLECSVSARKTYEESVDALRLWAPHPFDPEELEDFFERRVLRAERTMSAPTR